MIDLKNTDDWADYNLSFFDGLNLYLAESIDCNTNEDRINGLVNTNGAWVYTCNYEDFIGLKQHCYCAKNEQILNKKVTFFLLYTKTSPEKYSAAIYKYENENLVPLFPELDILNSIIISPTKLVVALPILGNTKKISVKIIDVANHEIIDVIDPTKIEDYLFSSQLRVHSVFGDNCLFSVQTRAYNNDTSECEAFILFDHNGKMLLDFETTLGESGEETFFEPTKTSFGVVYKKLKHAVVYNLITSRTSVCLIDAFGNYYGEFLCIIGTTPNLGAKTNTVFPKFIDGKILCLSLPEQNGISYLVIVDKEGNKIQTQYQCPWMTDGSFNRFSFIKDKKYFGKKCLVVIDGENKMRLIDLEGKLIDTKLTADYKGVWYEYSKYFINQASSNV